MCISFFIFGKKNVACAFEFAVSLFSIPNVYFFLILSLMFCFVSISVACAFEFAVSLFSIPFVLQFFLLDYFKPKEG